MVLLFPIVGLFKGTHKKLPFYHVLLDQTFAGFRLYFFISESMLWQDVSPSSQFRSVGHEQHFHGVHIQLIFRLYQSFVWPNLVDMFCTQVTEI